MGKFLVRVTIVFTSLYFLLSYLLAQFGGIDILKDGYSILFELCVVVYAYSEGKYIASISNIPHLLFSLAIL